jgi:4'-phosphopantetheinyl transferase
VTIALGRDEVHVWCASLDEAAPHNNNFIQTLAADERARADRFYFEIDRARFIAAHGILRAILSLYLDRAPDRLQFSYGAYGKPALANHARDSIDFNLSHSRGVALYAIARGREVGVDLELIRPELETEQIARQFFSPREIATLLALPVDVRREAFFLCWTRKEAYLKARGAGLSLPLDQFDVSLTPGEPAALTGTRPDAADALRWSLVNLSPPCGYAGAIAVEGRGWTLSNWQWPRQD